MVFEYQEPYDLDDEPRELDPMATAILRDVVAMLAVIGLMLLLLVVATNN